jgi:glycosyltransferase involved in cell wall biosynthesis
MGLHSREEDQGIIKVAAFTGGRAVPSARFRLRQYVERLARMDICINELPCRLGKYPPAQTMLRPLWLLALLGEQARNYAALREYDVVLLQREIVSKLLTFERWTGPRTLLDVDDAIYLYRSGYVARRLAEQAALVVCGNAHLAEWFSQWNPKVRIIPTGVDTDRYRLAERSSADGEGVIGWIGTSSNLHEIAAIERPLVEVLSRFPRAKLRVISDRPPKLPRIDAERLEYVPWSEEAEVGHLQGMDIGIMPLQPSPWALGKCSFKMLQYMACGVPSVVSAVGMNAEIARMGECSLAVRDSTEWVDALTDLLGNVSRRRIIGTSAREVAEQSFSVKVLAPRVAEAIREVAGV